MYLSSKARPAVCVRVCGGLGWVGGVAWGYASVLPTHARTQTKGKVKLIGKGGLTYILQHRRGDQENVETDRPSFRKQWSSAAHIYQVKIG
jgi:hypothetical protein